MTGEARAEVGARLEVGGEEEEEEEETAREEGLRSRGGVE